MDETRVQVMNEIGRADSAQSFHVGDAWRTSGKPCSISLSPHRSATVPLQYLSGYEGFLQTDGYEGYSEVGALAGITHVGCWAHTRRKFDEAAKSSRNLAVPMRLWGGLESSTPSKESCALRSFPEMFIEHRKEQVLPILRDFRQWLEIKALQVPPRRSLAKQ